MTNPFNQFFYEFMAALFILSPICVIITGAFKTMTGTKIHGKGAVVISFLVSWLFPGAILMILNSLGFVTILAQMTWLQFLVFSVLVTLVSNRIFTIEAIKNLLTKYGLN